MSVGNYQHFRYTYYLIRLGIENKLKYIINNNLHINYTQLWDLNFPSKITFLHVPAFLIKYSQH